MAPRQAPSTRYRFSSCYGLRITDCGLALLGVFALTLCSASAGEEAGPFAKYRIEPEPEAPADPYISPPWIAHWIWLAGEPKEPIRLFRRAVELSDKPKSVFVTVTADAAFDLYVNGTLVGGNDDWHVLKEYNLTRYFREGRNVFAVKVRKDEPGPAGFLLQGDIVLPDRTHIQIASDTSWRAAKSAPESWASPDFDAKDWVPAESWGKHPCRPWATPSTSANLAYHGPRYRLLLDDVKVRRVVRPDEALTFRLTLMALDRFPPNVPFIVEMAAEGEKRPWRVGLLYPKPPSNKWPVNEVVRTGELAVKLPHTLFLTPGTYDVYLRPTAAVFEGRTDYLVNTTRLIPYDADPTRSGHAGPVDLRQAGLNGSTLVDAKGFAHRWHLTDKGTIRLDGLELMPVDGSDGVYWSETDVADASRGPLADLRSKETLDAVARRGLGEMPVRCRLVDTIDCTQTDRMYSDDLTHGGTSRVLTIHGREYRVTDARKATSYFALTAFVQNRYRPHVFVYETPNDIERYTFVRIQPPWSHVGGGVYTGRDLPLDGKPHRAMFLFYPQEKAVRFTVSRIPAEREPKPESGAAVSRVWILEVTDTLLDRASDQFTDHGGIQRRVGLAANHPAYFYSQFGRDDRREPANHRLALLRFAEYLRFIGLNHLEVDAIGGGDTTEEAFYPSALFPQTESINLFRDLLSVTDRAGISVVPTIAPLDIEALLKKPETTRETFQVDRDGKSVREPIEDCRAPDPLRPEVQKVLFACLNEMGKACRGHSSVVGLGFRVDGKFGLGYVGYSEQTPAQWAGYSAWDIAQFCRDARLKAEDLQPTPADWIAKHAWKKWMDWRCQRTRDLWLKARAVVRAHNSMWNLVVRTHLPSETPGRNVDWVRGAEPLDLFRTHGYDPTLFRNDGGIVVQQSVLLDADRYCDGSPGGASQKRDTWAYRAFDFAPGLPALFRTREPGSIELRHAYWEEFGIWPQGEFECESWGAGTAWPLGRYAFEPLAHAVRAANPRDLVLSSWERGTFGHEHDLRAFVRCFRALPYAAPREYTASIHDSVTPAPEAPAILNERERPPEGELWIRWFGERLAILNDGRDARQVTLYWPRPLPMGFRIVDLATMQTLVDAEETSVRQPALTVSLRAFDLHTVLVLPRPRTFLER